MKKRYVLHQKEGQEGSNNYSDCKSSLLLLFRLLISAKSNRNCRKMSNFNLAVSTKTSFSSSTGLEKCKYNFIHREKRQHVDLQSYCSPKCEKNETVTSTVTSSLENVADDDAKKSWIPVPIRYLMLFLAFTGFNCVYALRVNLSVAIVAMTNSSSVEPLTNTVSTHHNISYLALHDRNNEQCPTPQGLTLMHYDNSPAAPNAFELQQQARSFPHLDAALQFEQFQWSEAVKSQILAAFFYGYTLMQLPASYFAERFGAHRVFGVGVLCTAVLTLLTPLAANTSPWALFGLRFLEGLFEGVTFPAMHVFWSYWAPVPERSRLVGICYCGAQFGTIFAVPLAGVLAAHLGWPSIFYVFGGVACVWSVFWFIFSAHKPSQSRWISRKECAHIEANTDRADRHQQKVSAGGGTSSDDTGSKRPPVPWMKFARSPAVYAVSLSHFGINWGLYTYLTELPSYMNNVLKFNSTQNGLLSALPYVAMWSMQMTSSIAADKLRNWQKFRYSRKNTVIRRTCNALGLFVPAVIVCCIPAVGCNHVGAVAMLVLSLGFAGFSSGGYQVNHVDIASEYAGALMGVSNTLATIPGFVTPALVAWTAGSASAQTISSWSPFFYLSAGIFAFCGIINCLFTSGERLPWMDEYVASSRPLAEARSNNDSNENVDGKSSRQLKEQISTVTMLGNI